MKISKLKLSKPKIACFGYPLLLAIGLLFLGSPSSNAGTEISVLLDATDISRKIVHSRLIINSDSFTKSLLYPKWVPGIHAPRGPIQNIAGLTIADSEGNRLKWKRDPHEVYRLYIESETANLPISVNLSYICNQPSTNSRGVDNFGTPELGVINWNTVVVYPEGLPVREITVNAGIILPEGWGFGTALPFDKRKGDTVLFKPVTLEEFLDMPLICGSNFQTIELLETDLATYFLHLAADDPADLPQNDSIFIPFRNMILEAEALFGRTHFDEYHLLLTLSKVVPRLGLEHRNSSLNAVKANELREAKWKDKRTPYLIPHEFAHAWCGKYRRPEGMLTADFMEDKNTNLLWVYEGLDQYLGHVLAVRSGFVPLDDFKGGMASTLGGFINKKGRRWRTLQDTEVAGYTLRGGSSSWSYLRRGQDYYAEGAMIWMEFDSRIRNATNNEKSLDDFCRDFFSAGDPLEHAVPFSLSEIVTRLNNLVELPWDSLIDAKVYQVQQEYEPEAARYAGYRLEYTDEKPDYIKQREKRYKTTSLYESLGFAINDSKKISDIIPESLADSAGMYPGMEIVGVNGKKYTKERLTDALKQTKETGSIMFLTLAGDEFREIEILYDKGLQYYILTPLEGFPDRISDIMKPVVTAESAETDE